jgi:NitT/TauT family transport system substrate-binding protein
MRAIRGLSLMARNSDRPRAGRCFAGGALFQALRPWLAAAVVALAIVQGGTRLAAALTLGTTQNALLIWIADEQGYFNDEGLDVHIRTFQSGLDAANAMVEGQVELSTSSETTLVSLSFTQPDLRILAVISTSDTVLLIGRKDRGIRIAADLAGKRVGVMLGSAGEYFLTRYLTLQSVPATAPVIINLDPAQVAQRLTSGEIDAGMTWEPFAHMAELALQGNAQRLPDQIDQAFQFLMLAKRSWVEENKEQLGGFLSALLKAQALASDNPAKAKELIRKRFKYSKDYVDYIWPLHNLHISLPQGLLPILERQAEWQIGRGLTNAKTVPVYLDFIDTAPLAALRPSSVGIVK